MGVLARINADRAEAGLPPVAWDEAASRLADAYCEAQVAEGTRRHSLTDGVPPYARTSFAGISGMGSENSVAWITTAPAFEDSALALALAGHADMMRETPPNDGHRKAILDPEATHVGVGWSMKGGSFRMAQEFLNRKLAALALGSDGGTLLVRGKPVPGYSLQFVTIAWEREPEKLSKDEIRSRTFYTYPDPRFGLVAEGRVSMRVVGVDTNDIIRMAGGGEFPLPMGAAPVRPLLLDDGLLRAPQGTCPRPRPGGSAVFWVSERGAK